MGKTLQVIGIVVALIIGIATILVMNDQNESELAGDSKVIQNNNQTVIIQSPSEHVPELIPPTAVISGPDKITTDTLVTFTGDKSNDPDGFVDKQYWYVDGVKKSEEKSFFEYSFQTEGTYEIALVIFDDDNQVGKTTKIVHVFPKPPSHDPPKILNVHWISGDEKCSWNEEWCYKFTDKNIQKINQNHLEVFLKFTASGSKINGQVDAVMTITDPNSKTPSKSKQIVYTINGHSHEVLFNVPLTGPGNYFVFFELTDPNRKTEHVFDHYTLEFDVK